MNRMKRLGRRLLADEKVRFLAVGGFNTAFGFAMFVLVDIGLGRLLAENTNRVFASIVTLLVSHFIGSFPAFYLYRRFVFKVSGTVIRDFLRFQSVYVVPLTLNILALPLLVWLGLNAIVAQGLIVCVNVLINYFGHKYISFRRKSLENNV